MIQTDKIKKIKLVPFFRDLKEGISIIWMAGKGLAVVNIVLSVIQALMPVASLFFIKGMIEIVTALPKVNTGGLLWAIGGFTVSQFILAAAGQYAVYIGTLQQQKVTDYMSILVLAKAVSVDMEYYENPEYHDSLHMAQLQSQYRSGQLLGNLNAMLLNTLSLLFLASLFFIIQWQYAFIFIGVSLPLAFVKWFYSYKIFKIETQFMPQERESNYLHSILTGASFAKEVRAFGTAPYFISKYKAIRANVYNGKKDVHRRLTAYSILAQAIEAIIVALVFISLGRAVAIAAMSIGVFVVYLQGFQRLQSSSKNFLQSLIQLFQQRLFLKDIFKFLTIAPVRDKEDAVKFPVLNSGLSVQNLSFTYPGAAIPTLLNVSLSCTPGHITAIVGQNGSGKSTLVKLLTRMYQPEKNCIFLDGEDITNIRLEDFRDNSIVLFQDYEKYFFTVNENIAFDAVIENQQKVTNAAKSANAHNFISKLPNQYNTRLGRAFRESIQLSGGQWQKLAIARVFYKDAPFMILDEPTSSIDAIAENSIYNNLKETAKNKIIILISHRLYNLRIANKIYVMKDGTIVEEGTYDELLKQDGYFKELFSSQKV